MEWLSRIQSKTVGLDTSPLIYFIEDNQNYRKIIHSFFESLDRGDFSVITSTLTLTEVLVHPLRSGNHKLASRYRDILLNQKNLLVVQITVEIAEIAADLRAKHQIRTPDALQIAAALDKNVQFFLTNDKRLSSIKELEVLVLDTLLEQE